MYIIISLLILYSYGTRAAVAKWFNRCMGEDFRITCISKLTIFNWSHHGVWDKPLALCPEVHSSISGSYSLLDEALAMAIMVVVLYV